MLKEDAAPFTLENYQEMTDEGHVFLRDKSAKIKGNEILFAGITVKNSCEKEANVLNALEDLKAFYKVSLGESFEGTEMILEISAKKKNRASRLGFIFSDAKIQISTCF